MAKDLNRSIKIIIDHSDAMKKASDFENKISKVNQKLNDLNNQGKKDSKEYKAQEKILDKLTASYNRWKTKAAETERVLKNLSGATRGELVQAQRELRRSLDDCVKGSDIYKARLKALLAVEKQLTLIKKEMNGTMGKNATLWSRMADGFNKYFGIATSIIAGITGISMAFRKLAEDVAKMDDVYSDVMKTTNLTREQVLNLNDSFKEMDTRTSREELNRLARDAGKLGIEGQKNILDFVEAGNQINVALGDDLGEGAIKNIGKMTDVYAISTRELERMDLKGKMLAIGSAINELGMSSTASEKYMVNFTQRLGGVASQAGISIQNILGYASALDQSGQAVEMSATALQKFIMKLMGEPEKFARLAGLEIKAFNELLQKDTNAAIKQVLTALSDKGGFQALIPIFKDMGLDGARAVGVLSALATNIDKVEEAQSIANKAFADGTSITDEYSIKNTNLNAQLEKARKNFKDAALDLGESLNPVLLKSTKWTTYLIKAMPSVLNFFEKYGKTLLYLTGVGTAYIAGVKLQVLWNTKLAGALTLSNIQLKLKNGWLITTRVAILAYNAAVALLTGNVTRAAAAWKLLNNIIKTSWLGLALAAVTALGVAIYNYTQRTKEAVTQTKRLEEVNNEANRAISAERSEINLLLSVARNEKISKEERLNAIKRLNEISPEYLGNLNLENINTQAATESVKKYTEELLKNARAKSIQNKIQTESDKMFNLDEQIIEKRKEIEKLQKELDEIELGSKVVSPSARAGMANRMANATILISRMEKEKAAIQETMDTYTEFYQDIYKTSTVKKQQTEFQKLNDLLQRQADIYNKIQENKNNVIYNATQKKQDEQQLQMLGYQIEAQKKLAEEEAIRMKKDPITETAIPTGGTPDNNFAARQKQELNLILEGLETIHQQKLYEIKEKYRKGEIESESDFETSLFAQESAYYLLREQALTDFLENVTDKELQSDISKQLSVIRNKRIDDEINFRKKIQQIILDADPEEKERIAYEKRLRDVGLFGVDRESLTKEQLHALELLEQQHQDNLVRIRKDAKRKQKAASEEEFEANFKDRKEQLQKEIADEEQALTINKGLGTMSNARIFDAEVALQEKKIALIREEAEARRQAGLDITNVLKKQRSEELNLTRVYVDEFNRRRQQYSRYATDMGTALGNLIIGQENALQSFANVTLDILFDTLTQIINAEIIKVVATGTSAISRATAEAMATPGSALTFGAKGFATAAVLTAAITGAMTIAKTALKGLLGKKNNPSGGGGNTTTTYQRVVSQQSKGKYDVIGADDGKLYQNVPFAGVATTGIVHTPTLVAEDGGELVVSSPDLKALQKHINYPLIVQAINDVRAGAVQQRAAGKYDSIDQPLSNPAATTNNSIPPELLVELIATMRELRDKELELNIQTFEKKSKKLNDARNLGKRK